MKPWPILTLVREVQPSKSMVMLVILLVLYLLRSTCSRLVQSLNIAYMLVAQRPVNGSTRDLSPEHW